MIKIKLKRPINESINTATDISESTFSDFTRLIENKECNHEKTFNDNEIYKGFFDKRSWLDPEGEWHVFPIAINKHSVLVICPHCGQIHGHGRKDGSFYGHRVDMCSGALISKNMYKDAINTGYTIEDPELLDDDSYELLTKKHGVLYNSFENYN